MNVVLLDERRAARMPRPARDNGWWIVMDDGSLRLGRHMLALQEMHRDLHCWEETYEDGSKELRSHDGLRVYECSMCYRAASELATDQDGGPFDTPCPVWSTRIWRSKFPPEPPVPPATRVEVYRRDGHACGECAATENLILHKVIPIREGGTVKADNLKVLCRTCAQAIRNRRRTQREAESQTT